MSINLGSGLLDAIFALAFVYFLLSLIVSAGTEAISWFLQQRAKNLEDGLKTLLTDDAKAKEVLSHPLVKAVNKERKLLPNVELPSYLSPRNFALALVDTLTEPGKTLTQAVSTLPDDLKRQLNPLLEDAGHEMDAFRTNVERWYDDAMDRISGWYKRWAQLITIVLAVIVTVSLNVDTIRVADRLFNDEAVRNSVVAAGDNTLKEHTQQAQSAEPTGNAAPGSEPTQTEGETTKSADPLKAGKEAEKATSALTALKLPIGWDGANDPGNVLALLAGWLLTAVAISLGAPFWFDAMSKLARLRTTGGKPEGTNGSH